MLNLLAVFLVCSGIGIAVHIAIDLTHRPQSMKIMNAVWILTALWGSYLALWAYNKFGQGAPMKMGGGEMKMDMSGMKDMNMDMSMGDMSMKRGKGFVFLHHQFDIPAIDALVHHYLHPLRDFIMSCVVTGRCYMIYLIRQSQQVQVENQQLRAENLLNQYEALKSQLNPHMLFNSLNTLRSLIRETPGKAQEYLQELSRVLRYTLQENECRSVTLREEMDFVNAYIFLLKMRYEDNLVFDIDLGKEHESKQLPPMSVQLLIENAVKHNEISNRHSLTISVRSDHDCLTVSNRIQPKLTHSGGTGIGLVNLSKRYNLLYKKDISIKEDASIFSVTIPLV